MHLDFPGVSVGHLHPPYIHPQPVPEEFPPGSFLLLDVRDPAAAAVSLRESAPRLRSAFPAVPLLLRVPAALDAGCVRLAQLAAGLRVRAVLVDGEPVADTLRRVLPHPLDLGGDVEEWLMLGRVRMGADLARLVRSIFRAAAEHGEITPLLRSLGECDSTVRARFRARALPPPGDWLAAARALRALLRLQARPEASLLTVAMESGYGDHSALSRQVHHLFGVRPGAARGCLGWEWLLDGWLSRARPPRGG